MSNIKSILALVLLVAFIGGAYYVVSTGTLFVGPKDRHMQVQADTQKLKSEIITPLNKLTSVSIDVSLFSSMEYKALVDKSVDLRDPDLQRPNPFSPVGRYE